MEMNYKDLEQLIASLKPTGLSDCTLSRLEMAMCGRLDADASHAAVERSLHAMAPRSLSDDTFEKLFCLIENVAFPMNAKVVLFPVAHKQSAETQPVRRASFAKRITAIAAVATLGGLAALWTPVVGERKISSTETGVRPNFNQSGVVATNYGSDIETAADEGVIWTEDHQPRRVLRIQYQDRVLVRDQNGVERMLFLPREEVYVVPEKVD
jgi:hypothetical protein